jgi:4-cresol dehydrogenase (hydroxylating)
MTAEISADLREKLISIVGPAHWLDDEAALTRWSRTTMPAGARPSAVIQPANRDQVASLMKALRGTTIRVFPVSRGKNWGYGDACAPDEGALILDLSRLNRIIEVNTELAYAVIEPGVTQGQLAQHLASQKIPLQLDCTGAGPDASVIGNTLERGFGHSRYGDRFAHVCDFELVLADGSVVRTGFGAYDGKAARVYKTGIGPTIDGLFTQSSLGIVTAMSVWLIPKPESAVYSFISLSDRSAIGELIERIRPLFLAGTLRSTMHIFNDGRLLASASRFPWDRADGKQALEKQHPELYRTLCRQNGVPAWAGSAVLTGSAEEVAAARKTIRRALRGLPHLERLVFISDRMLRWAETLKPAIKSMAPLAPLAALLDKVRLGVDLLDGKPSVATLQGAHWRARNPAGPNLDPLDTRAGMIWISPVAPMTAEHVRRLLAICEPIFHEHGFEFQVTLSCVNPRAICGVTSISFDQANPDECRRAAACESKLLETLLKERFVPYRGSRDLRDGLRTAAPAFWELIGKIRNAVDPEGRFGTDRYFKK